MIYIIEYNWDIMGEWGNRSIIKYRLTVYWGSNGNRILRICCESRGDLLGIFHGHKLGI